MHTIPYPAMASPMSADAQGGLACLRKGRNCGWLGPCDHAALIVDSARYFRVLAKLFEQARRSIVIVGWDFDGSICLTGLPGTNAETLGHLLRRLVEERPELKVHILIWSLSIFHAPGDPYAKLFGTAWQRHPRISLRLDREHPINACHHQKIVVIDDSIAFVGGIDLTVGRRDRRGHSSESVRRNPDGTPYGPVHDVQMMVDGPVASAIGAIGRQLWTTATGERLAEQPGRGLWPADMDSDFRGSTIGLSCTYPNWRGRPAVHEGVHLAIDMLRDARQAIYIEAQYFAASFLADVLIPALEADAGPEIVLILSGEWHSRIEKRIFGGNRDRLLRRLKRADRHGRLAAFFPQAPSDNGPACVLVHSKVIIVDDRILRVGSSNLNNRSTGLDAECDLAVEACSPADRAGIDAVRARLLADHLGSDPATLSREIVSRNSVIGAIGALDPDHRRLVPFAVADEGPVSPVFGTALVDPARPFRWTWPKPSRPAASELNVNSANRKTTRPNTSGNK
jgi:phosphatidylserine/phosphatidylglycerophosphate/cardiolipin synthase-like enzyme